MSKFEDLTSKIAKKILFRAKTKTKRLKRVDKLMMRKKQPPGVFYEKRCSLKFHKIHRRTPVPEPPL